jgi:hypothetical protein
MTSKEQLQKLAMTVMSLDHMGIQCDIHCCEQKHQAILALDKLDKHDAIRLLIHVIHVQQLQLVGAKIEFDESNPFKDMVMFEHIRSYVSLNSPDMDSLY